MKSVILLTLILLLGACANYKTDKRVSSKEKRLYSSKGFALIYTDSLFEQGGVDKKFNTNEITVTYGTSEQGRIRLDKLNDEIAKDRGVKVSELAIKDESGNAPVAEKTPTKKSDAKKTTKK